MDGSDGKHPSLGLRRSPLESWHLKLGPFTFFLAAEQLNEQLNDSKALVYQRKKYFNYDIPFP